MKILNVVGARPNFVKIAPLISEMQGSSDIDPLLVHTGQHHDMEMSDSFFRDLEIPQANYHLHVNAGSRAWRVAEIMRRLEPVIAPERPEVVLVVGDVDSTLAGALTAFKLGVPVAHVEAGLRSFDPRMPEEINRVLTDAVSELFFASEPSGVKNLSKEGCPAERVFLVGNVMIDTLKRTLFRMESAMVPYLCDTKTCRAIASESRYALLTLHRKGLVDDPILFGRIWKALLQIGHRIPIIFPVHPRTRLRLQSMGLQSLPASCRGHLSQGVHMIPPLGYLDFLRLQKQAALVLTDSGGVQEETTALGVPCLTLRENTERPFTVTHGTNTIVGLDPERVCREVGRLLSGDFKQRTGPSLWDGRASVRIVRILREYFQKGRECYRHHGRWSCRHAFPLPFIQVRSKKCPGWVSFAAALTAQWWRTLECASVRQNRPARLHLSQCCIGKTDFLKDRCSFEAGADR